MELLHASSTLLNFFCATKHYCMTAKNSFITGIFSSLLSIVLDNSSTHTKSGNSYYYIVLTFRNHDYYNNKIKIIILVRG